MIDLRVQLDQDTRIVPPTGQQSLRDKIVQYIVLMFKNIVYSDADPTGPMLFDTVGRGTLDDISADVTPACMIEEGQEASRLNFYPAQDETLRIYVNFKTLKGEGVDVYSLLNYYIARIRMTLIRPEDDGLHLSDLTMSVRDVGNSIQYNGDSDPEPGGTVMFDIEYRHVLGNPIMEL